jgi:hypothetical protein
VVSAEIIILNQSDGRPFVVSYTVVNLITLFGIGLHRAFGLCTARVNSYPVGKYSFIRMNLLTHVVTS